jgi:serine/threonine protein kinase
MDGAAHLSLGAFEHPANRRPNTWFLDVFNDEPSEAGSHPLGGAGLSRTDVMSDPLGDPLRNASANLPPSPPPSNEEDDAVNLLDDSAEPTDDSPTVITKAVPPQGILRLDDHGGSLRGRRLAHFELIEPIGVGGMAAVLRARDTQLDRLVALKILPPEMAADPENVRRFHQEARSAARLDHENIARVFFCGEDQRLHFIAFEFVEGDNLRTILDKRGRLPVGEALHYMLQVAAGLAHASRRGVVHRDIKPSNIIITPNGRAKLVDMGLARSMEPQQDGGLTQSGVTLGTFDYISPEQALEPRDADVRSDIYSLGCTFYHMLTGQAPVPEGTAAKKLHHHQHVKPPDPRQFVADLPDEAAIILDRMMAKQPKDRYQTPEHLVHHLYLAARKLGAAAEVPEGVLAVEAAMPTPPGSRPLVLAALAALAVVGLIFLIDWSSSTKPEPTPNLSLEFAAKTLNGGRPSPESPAFQGADAPHSGSGDDHPQQLVQPLIKQPRIPIFNDENPKPEALAEFLRANKEAHEIILELDDLDLQPRDDKPPPYLVVNNPVVTIRPRKLGQRPTIRDRYRAQVGQKFQASLIIQSQQCTIENIRFVLDQTGVGVPMAMLWLRDTRDAHIHRCEFIQAYPFGEKSRMASILAESREPAALTLTESSFVGFASLAFLPEDGGMVFNGAASGGQDAVTRRGPVRIDANNCVFGPHAATFRLEGNAADDLGLVQLKHCSVLAAGPSALFDVADGADARIDMSFSLVSYPGEAGAAEGKGAVLLHRASRQGRVTYQGRENRYHQLDDYLVVADAPDPMAQHLPDDLKNNKSSRELDASPWQAPQPLEQLKKLDIKTAFAVKTDRPELRVPSDERELIGAEHVLAFSYLDNLPQIKQDPAVSSRRELVVEKGVNPDADKHLYPTLGHALLDARPGDIVRLRLDGEVKLDPQALSSENCSDLTIRADPRFHPVLTLSDTDAVNASLFAVYNGTLRLEGLEVRLRPRRDDTDGSAVISFVGDGECVLQNCLITLEKSNRKAALALLPEKRMRKTTPQKPRLILDHCFVRGQGDLIGIQGSHGAEVTIDNSLIALSGSLLHVESDKEVEKDQPASSGSLTLRLRRVTTYLGDNLLRLRAAKDIKGLAKTRCDAADCLFLPAGERALVRLEGPDGQQRGLREKFSWESSGKNAYGNFTALLDQQSVDDTMSMPPPSNLETWKKDVSGEMNSEYNVKLPSPPAADAAFTQLLPKAFQPSDILKDYGVDIQKLRALSALKGQTDVSDLDLEDEGGVDQ